MALVRDGNTGGREFLRIRTTFVSHRVELRRVDVCGWKTGEVLCPQRRQARILAIDPRRAVEQEIVRKRRFVEKIAFGEFPTGGAIADRVDHLRQLRALQDETHGFVGFVPLPYQPQDNDIPVETAPTGFDSLRTIAVSRIYLDNFDHITAYWVGLGIKLAQVALSYGADDIHGTIIEEHIFHMAGANSPQQQTEATLVKTIREAGRTPVQRNTFYEPIKVWEAESGSKTEPKQTTMQTVQSE